MSSLATQAATDQVGTSKPATPHFPGGSRINPECYPDFPGWLRGRNFWVKKQLEACRQISGKGCFHLPSFAWPAQPIKQMQWKARLRLGWGVLTWGVDWDGSRNLSVGILWVFVQNIESRSYFIETSSSHILVPHILLNLWEFPTIKHIKLTCQNGNHTSHMAGATPCHRSCGKPAALWGQWHTRTQSLSKMSPSCPTSKKRVVDQCKRWKGLRWARHYGWWRAHKGYLCKNGSVDGALEKLYYTQYSTTAIPDRMGTPQNVSLRWVHSLPSTDVSGGCSTYHRKRRLQVLHRGHWKMTIAWDDLVKGKRFLQTRK